MQCTQCTQYTQHETDWNNLTLIVNFSTNFFQFHLYASKAINNDT